MDPTRDLQEGNIDPPFPAEYSEHAPLSASSPTFAITTIPPPGVKSVSETTLIKSQRFCLELTGFGDQRISLKNL